MSMTPAIEPDETITSAFEDVVSGWDASFLRCQTTQIECRNPATWMAVLHKPCGHKPICAVHYNLWLAKAVLSIADYGYVGCPDCYQDFATIDQAAQFHPL